MDKLETRTRKTHDFGFKHQGKIDLLIWANQLRNLYWLVHVEGRDKVKRCRYYRYMTKEKLHLAEQNIDQELITAICRYLSGLNGAYEQRLVELLNKPMIQMILNFHSAK